MSRLKIVVYGFGNTPYFFRSLIERYGQEVDWSVILPRWHYKDLFSDLLPRSKILYLYEHFNECYRNVKQGREVGGFEFAPEADSEFVCLLKDKGGYKNLNGEEQLVRSQAIVKIYRKFLETVKPDFILFPDLEVVDGFLLLSLCISLGIRPIYYVGLRFLGGGFLSGDSYETLPKNYGSYTDEHLMLAQRFLTKFNSAVIDLELQPYTDYQAIIKKSLLKRIPAAIFNHLKYESKYVGEDNWYIRLRANFLPILSPLRRKYFDLIQHHLFNIRSFSNDLVGKNYGFYALQYTPESSINGLEPYYVDQLRVIDALLMAMPSGYRLLVKEHPAIVGLRSSSFYRQLKNRPGVILVSPDVDSKHLIVHSKFTATVTGTIGLESYLIGKPCIVFGRNFFSHLCVCVSGITNLKEKVNFAINDFVAPSFEERAQQLAKFFAIRRPIDFVDPLASPSVLSIKHVDAYFKSVNEYISFENKL